MFVIFNVFDSTGKEAASVLNAKGWIDWQVDSVAADPSYI